MARAMRQSVSSIHLSIRSRASFTGWTHPNRGKNAARELLEARFAILDLKLLEKRTATLDSGHERQTSRIQRIAETPESLRRNEADLERRIADDSRSRFILGWSNKATTFRVSSNALGNCSIRTPSANASPASTGRYTVLEATPVPGQDIRGSQPRRPRLEQVKLPLPILRNA